MSDYLGHLAARSLDPARTAVRPRLASRFEPVAPWAPPIEMERVEEAPAPFETRVEEIATTPPSEPLPVKPRTTAPEPVEEEPPAPVRARVRRRSIAQEPPAEPVLELQSAEASRTRRAATESLAELSAPALPRRVRRTVEEKAPEQPSQPAKPVAVRPALSAPVTAVAPPPQAPLARPRVPLFEPSPPVLLSRRERRDVVRAEIADPGPPRHQAGVQAAPRQETPAPAFPARAERGEDAPATRPAPPARAVLEPRVTVAPPAPLPVFPVPVRAAEAPAPTIQVTIGRIEVRATPLPAQPSRPRPSAPSALSLEEYLRRRSKGGDG